MAKHLSIKYFWFFLLSSFLLNAFTAKVSFADNLDGTSASGSNTSTAAIGDWDVVAQALNVVIPDDTTAGATSDILAVATFSTQTDTATTTYGEGMYRIHDTTNNVSSGPVYRHITDDTKGIGSVVWIFQDVPAGTATFQLQHANNTVTRITTDGTLVVMPLTANTLYPLAWGLAPAALPSPVVATTATPAQVISTTVDTTTPNYTFGDFYVAASVQCNKTASGGATAEGVWQLEYNSGSGWNALGYPVHRTIKGTPPAAPETNNGIVNLVARLPQQTVTANYQFRLVHSHLGTISVNTLNSNLVAVFTGYKAGTADLYFPTYETHITTAQTTSSTPVEAIGYDFIPGLNTELFLHSHYWMRATGKIDAKYQLYVTGTPSYTGLIQDRSLIDGNDQGSGSSVGLAEGLLAGSTYRAQLRHGKDISGQTLTTTDPNLILWALNTFTEEATCPHIPPQTSTRTPGPDNCLYYDADAITPNYVSVPDNVDNSLDLTTPFTIECWIKPDALGRTQGIIGKGGIAGSQPSIRLNTSNQVEVYWNGTPHVSNTALPSTCQWYHIAATYANPNLTIYINGIPDGTFNFSTSPTNNASALTIGQTGDSNYFNGAIDEVRIWQYAFGTTVLRDWMCKKVTYGDGGHPNWNSMTPNDLAAYWRFDENGLDSTIHDEISYLFGTHNDGTAINFTLDEDRICSSAPIGDESAHDYNGTNPGDFSATLTYAPEGDFMTASGQSGTWSGSGLQLYLVDDAPNNNVPPFAWGTGYTLDPVRYWGVFVDNVFSANPVYQISYDWTLHQGLTKESWNSLKLADRDGNCDNPWQDRELETLNTVAPRTLTESNWTGTEFILGGNINSLDPLAITLAYFFAEIDDSGECIRISWKTATEIDTIGYYLLRSDSKTDGYTRISDSFIPAQAVSETTGASYAYTDCSVDLSGDIYYYYKLEEVDFDDQKTNPMYGPVGPVSPTTTSVKLSESFNSESDSKCFIDTLFQ